MNAPHWEPIRHLAEAQCCLSALPAPPGPVTFRAYFDARVAVTQNVLAAARLELTPIDVPAPDNAADLIALMDGRTVDQWGRDLLRLTEPDVWNIL